MIKNIKLILNVNYVNLINETIEPPLTYGKIKWTYIHLIYTKIKYRRLCKFPI